MSGFQIGVVSKHLLLECHKLIPGVVLEKIRKIGCKIYKWWNGEKKEEWINFALPNQDIKDWNYKINTRPFTGDSKSKQDR